MTKYQNKRVGLLGSVSLIVANMVGTGVFTSLGFQLEGVNTVFPILLLWLIGGLTAFCGAVSYRQLLCYFPDSGGEIHFVSRLYGKKASYFTGFVTLVFGFAAPIALSSLAIANYLIPQKSLEDSFFASGLIIFMSVFHSINIRTSNALQTISSILKVLILVVFIISGLWMGNQSGVKIGLNGGDLETIFSVPFMLSLMYVHYAYSGWNASIYVFREIRDNKTLYRSLFISVIIVTSLYILLNFVFLTSSGIDDLKGVVEVGEIAAKNIFGPNFGRTFSTVISLLLLSGVSAMIWAGSRVSMKIEELIRGSLSKQEIPRLHIIIQAGTSLLFIWFISFQTILTVTSIILSLCSVAVVAGLFFYSKKVVDSKPISLFVKICAIAYCLVISISNCYLLYAAVMTFV